MGRGSARACAAGGDGSSGRYLCGASPPEGFSDPDCDVDALETVDHQLFEEVIWPALYQRVPAFESLRVESSWAGLYEFCTLDQNAVVGWHPDASNLVVAAGFSDVEAGERLSLIDTFERKGTRDLLLEDALEDVASAGAGEAASSSSGAV